MPTGYSNLTGLPIKPPQGFVFQKGNSFGKESFKGKKHTPEAIKKMKEYQISHGGKNPYRFKKGHTAYNKTGESKYVIQRRADLKWRKNNQEKMRNYHLKRLYGITLEDFKKMSLKQGEKCAACHRIPKKLLFVDHNHTTGKVRGLLCQTCNTALGMVQDDPSILSNLITYLGNT